MKSLLFLSFIPAVLSACNDWAGATGSLSELQHDVKGTVKVLADCTLQIDDFSYDGTGPDVFVWGVKEGGSLRTDGVSVGTVEKRKFNNECFSHKLEGKTFDDLAAGGDGVVLSIWCRQFSANFGQVLLKKPSTPTASPALPTCGKAKGSTAPANDGCNGWAGATAQLSELQHQVAGTVVVKSDCTFQIDDFSYDGLGPDVFVWGIKDGQNFRTDGVALGSVEMRRFSNECFSHKLVGKTFDELADGGNAVRLSIWCKAFNANFGDVTLTKPASPESPPTAPTCGKAKGTDSTPPTEPPVVEKTCADWAGATGTLTDLTHAVAGTVTVQADCTFSSADFSYDGLGPDVFWYAVKPGNAPGTGTKWSSVPMREFKNECISGAAGDVEFEDVADGGDEVELHVYCKQFSSSFGKVILKRPAEGAANVDAKPAFCEGGCPARVSQCLPNCKQLAPNYNVWWKVDGDMIEVELEAEVDEGHWVGLGIADPDNYGMVGSDAMITSHLETGSVVEDYFLTAQSQCNYQGGADKGVCPDNGVSTCPNANGAKGKADLTVVSSERVAGVQRVRYTRKLNTGDPCDRAFTLDKPTPIIWGTGPLTQSNVMVVNIHDVKSAKSADLKLDLNATGIADECLATPSRPKKEDPTKSSFCVSLLTDVTEFDAIIENHGPEEYPNPPAWGVSWTLNGKKTPELIVRRGTKYTFKVGGTDQHPFYIVDNEFGGLANEAENVFAGSIEVWGTPEEPQTLEWTPDADTPDLVYYQCVTHQKLGWKIHVLDADADVALPSATSVCEAERPRSTTTTAAVTTAAPTEPPQDTDGSSAAQLTISLIVASIVGVMMI